jgi:hypothetical protein
VVDGANIHLCTDVSLIASYQVGRTRALLMGNDSLAHILGASTVNLKFTSGKTVLLKNVQHVPSIKKNLVSGSMCVEMATKSSLSPISALCQDMVFLLVKDMIAGVFSLVPT